MIACSRMDIYASPRCFPSTQEARRYLSLWVKSLLLMYINVFMRYTFNSWGTTLSATQNAQKYHSIAIRATQSSWSQRLRLLRRLVVAVAVWIEENVSYGSTRCCARGPLMESYHQTIWFVCGYKAKHFLSDFATPVLYRVCFNPLFWAEPGGHA